ncbi:exonuclease II Exo2, partial [Coemansia brasiliensis]
MCVLPPYSRKLLPSVLRPLMVDIYSPIRDLYPTSFTVDMNGKKMPWEAVVLIDFVDIDRIRAAMAPNLARLSEDEQRRNSRGKTMMYSYAPIDFEDDDNNAPEYIPPRNLDFPVIRPLKCKGIVYTSLKPQGSHTKLELIQGLVKKTVCRDKMRPGFPSLFTVPHTACLKFNHTEVFGSSSRDETLVLTLAPNNFDVAGTAAAIAPELLSGKHIYGAYRPRRIFVSWPYLKDSVLVGVSDESGVYTIDASGTNIVHVQYRNAGERQVQSKLFMDAINKYEREYGVVLPKDHHVLMHVLPLRGLQLYPDGSLLRDYGFAGTDRSSNSPWASVDSWTSLGVRSYPPSLVLSDLSGSWVNNPRFSEHEAIPLEKAFPESSRIFFLGNTPLYGSPGKVIGHGHDSNGTVVGVDMQLQAITDPSAFKTENFLGVNALSQYVRSSNSVYKPSYVVARQVGISPLLLSCITSRMMISEGDNTRIQVGLGLKFEAKRLKVPGYARRAPNGWQFSDCALDLIAKYKAAFPEMFACLEEACKNNSIASTAECLPLHEDAEPDKRSEVKRLKQWIKDN